MAKKKQSVPEYGTVTRKGTLYYRTRITDADGKQVSVPFPVSWTVKMKKKQKETQDILSYHTQAAGCS
ncbi:site-specific integrase, partial [Ruthenibacterium lactatiformans]|nr:site-specific integrase [Ruthenibacterium lactatiformans]